MCRTQGQVREGTNSKGIATQRVHNTCQPPNPQPCMEILLNSIKFSHLVGLLLEKTFSCSGCLMRELAKRTSAQDPRNVEALYLKAQGT